uniref:Calponin-homology (CH) domain-containing protein n=1 Tax=Caenorhabditis japonica TaxID=281687 RepID=A0A8R1DKH4_CAEJA
MEDRKEAMMKRLAARHEERILKAQNQVVPKKIDLKATEKAFLESSPSTMDMKTPIQPTGKVTVGYSASPILSFDEEANKQIIALSTWCNAMIGLDNSEEVDLGATKAEACKRIQKMLAKKTDEEIEGGVENQHQARRQYHRIFETNDSEKIKKQCQKILVDSGIDETIKEILSKNLVSVRKELAVYSDLSLQTSLLRVFLSFHPAWLKAALEAIFDKKLNPNPKLLIGTLSRFLIENVFTDARMLKNKKFAIGSGKPIVTAAGKDALHRHFLLITMKLMFLIETAHSQKIISNLTRIFTKSSCFKCLDDMASDLTKELLSGSSASLKKAFAKIGFTPSYKQSFVENYDYEAKGFENFSDGLILAKLIETIGEMEHGQLLLKLRDPAGDRIRKINNVKTVFAAMNEMGISTENATPACVVGGKKEAILSILWALIGVRVAKEKKIRIPRTVDVDKSKKRRSAVHEDVSSEVLKLCKVYGRELDVDVLDVNGLMNGQLLSKAWSVYVPTGLPVHSFDGQTLWEKVVAMAESELHIQRGLDQNVALFVKMFLDRMQIVRMSNENATKIQKAWRKFVLRKKTPKLYDVVCQVLSNRQSIGSSERSLSPCSTLQNGTFTISQFSDRQSIDTTLNDATFTVSRESVDSVGGFKMPKTPTRVTFSRTTISHTIDQVIEEEEDEDGEDTIVPSTARKRNVVSVEHKVFETFEESSELEGKEEEEKEEEEKERDENQDPGVQGISHHEIEPLAIEKELSKVDEEEKEETPSSTVDDIAETEEAGTLLPKNQNSQIEEDDVESVAVEVQESRKWEAVFQSYVDNQRRFVKENELNVVLNQESKTPELQKILRETKQLKRKQQAVAKKLGKIERDALAAKMSTDEAFVEWSVNSSQPLNRTDAGHDLEVEHEEEIEDADPDGSTNEMEAKAAVVIQKMIRGFLVRRRLRDKIENMRERADNYNRVLAHEDEQFATAGRTVAATTSSIEAKLRKSTLHGLTNANLHFVHLGATIIDRITDLVPSLLEKFVVELNGISLIYDILRVADRGYSYTTILHPLFNILKKSFANVPKEAMDEVVRPLLPKLAPRLAELMLAHAANQHYFMCIVSVLIAIGRRFPNMKTSGLEKVSYFTEKSLKKVSDPQCKKQLMTLKVVYEGLA